MKLDVNGVLLVEGVIKKVTFKSSNEKAVVYFEDGLEIEFRNAKKNRADHVRKLQLHVGERVIAIGAHSVKNPLYVFGFDIQRDGKLQNDNYTIIKGQVKQLVKLKSACMLYMGENKKQSIIKAEPSMAKDIKAGDDVTCICFQQLYQECTQVCNEWSISKCKCCQNKQTDKRLTALDLERRIS